MLAVYGFFAAALPVWLLLAPRDYLSTYLKIGTIGALALGIIIVMPEIPNASCNSLHLGWRSCIERFCIPLYLHYYRMWCVIWFPYCYRNWVQHLKCLLMKRNFTYRLWCNVNRRLHRYDGVDRCNCIASR